MGSAILLTLFSLSGLFALAAFNEWRKGRP